MKIFEVLARKVECHVMTEDMVSTLSFRIVILSLWALETPQMLFDSLNFDTKVLFKNKNKNETMIVK